MSSNFDKKGTEKEFQRLNWAITVVVIGLLFALFSVVVGFVGTINDSHRFKAETYQTLVDKVNILVQEKEQMEKDTEQAEIKLLRDELNDIRIKNPYLK